MYNKYVKSNCGPVPSFGYFQNMYASKIYLW